MFNVSWATSTRPTYYNIDAGKTSLWCRRHSNVITPACGNSHKMWNIYAIRRQPNGKARNWDYLSRLKTTAMEKFVMVCLTEEPILSFFLLM